MSKIRGEVYFKQTKKISGWSDDYMEIVYKENNTETIMEDGNGIFVMLENDAIKVAIKGFQFIIDVPKKDKGRFKLSYLKE